MMCIRCTRDRCVFSNVYVDICVFSIVLLQLDIANVLMCKYDVLSAAVPIDCMLLTWILQYVLFVKTSIL